MALGRGTPGAGGGLGGAYKPVIRPVVHASTPHTTTSTTTKTTPPWLNTAALTPQEIQDEATSQANAAVAPQVSGLQSQQATYDAQQKAYEAAMTGFYSALAPYMAGISGATSDAYNSAAATMGGIGQGYAGELGKAATNDANEMNAALARAGQTQAITTPNTGALTDAFAATNGGMQGTAFAQEGAAKAADAANRPAIWASQGRDSLTEAISKAVAGDANYADQIRQVYATVPALRDTIVKQIQSAEIDKQKLADDEQNIAFNQKAKVASLNLQASVAAFNEKAKIAGLKLTGERLNLTAQKYAQDTLNSNRNYALALSRVGISEKSLQLKALAQEYKLANGGFTAGQMNRFTSDAALIAQNAHDGFTDAKGKVYKPISYQAAMKEMLASHVPVSIATRYLNQAYPETQRPITPQTMKDYNQMTGVSSKATPFDLTNFAKDYLGVPYKWGGTNPTTGLDCSAFVQALYARVGVKLPRTTQAQVKVGTPVRLNQLKPGDLVFTEPGATGPNHVGVYLGNGQIQESPHTGDVNKIVTLQSFLTGGFVAARRYLHG